MKRLAWDEAIAELERATARLEAALPANTSLMEDALERRAGAIRRLQAISAPRDAETLTRLKKAASLGDAAQQKLILAREQIRDSIARLNQSSYLLRTFSPKPAGPLSALDCEG